MECGRGPTSLSLGRLAELSPSPRLRRTRRRVLALLEDDGVHGVSFQFKLRLEWWG